MAQKKLLEQNVFYIRNKTHTKDFQNIWLFWLLTKFTYSTLNIQNTYFKKGFRNVQNIWMKRILSIKSTKYIFVSSTQTIKV